jgi:hypothetical protein
VSNQFIWVDLLHGGSGNPKFVFIFLLVGSK